MSMAHNQRELDLCFQKWQAIKDAIGILRLSQRLKAARWACIKAILNLALRCIRTSILGMGSITSSIRVALLLLMKIICRLKGMGRRSTIRRVDHRER